MRRLGLVIVAVALVALIVVGCGGTDDGAASETPAAEATATEAAAGGTWTTVTTLHSDDPQETEGILISEPFTASGDVRFVLDMPDAGDMEGVLAVIIPEDQAGDNVSIMKALPDAQSITLLGLAPEEVVEGLDGSFVLVNSVPAKAWSVDVQTQQ